MIEKFRIDAKVTHKIYGIRIYEDVFENFLNDIMVSRIAIHNRTISIKAIKGFLNPKNKIDHNVLRASCIAKMDFALRSAPFVSAIYKDIPISMYKIVQTGPNNQFGGLKNGLFSVEYQLSIDVIVKMLPINPAARHNIIDKINL